jgi:tetratricopeptide (TPR) repeat protein
LKITKDELTILWPLSAILGLFFAIKKNWRIALFLFLFFIGHVSFFIWYWDSGTIYVASYLVVMALGGAGIYCLVGLFENTKIPKASLIRMAAVICASFVLFSFLKNYGRLDKSSYYAVEDLASADYMRFDYDSMVLTSLYWPFFYYFQDVERKREDINVVSLSDIFQPGYFNTVTEERLPGIEIPKFGYDSKTWGPFLRELLYLNHNKRGIYFGPDQRMIETLSSQLLPEIFFYRLVPPDEVKDAGPEYYVQYLDRLYRFISIELASRKGEFFADTQYKAYYEVNFNVLSLYLTENHLWEIDKSIIKVAEIIIGPTSRLRLDMINSLTRLGEYQEAEELFRWLISQNPDEVWLYINFGHNLIAQDRYGEAVSEFEEALSIGGADAEAHLGIGISMFREGRYPEAFDALTRARGEITENTSENDINDILNLLEEVKDYL